MKRILIPTVVLAVITVLAATVPCLSFQTAATQPSPAPASTVQVDASSVRPSYANFSRVTGTPEEVIIDFGLNEQASGVPKRPIQVDHRIVMSFYTTKRLVAALQVSIDRHEQVFGTVETDIEKRVKPRK